MSTEIPAAQEAPAPQGDTTKGFVLAFIVFMLWGVLPLYMKLVTHLPTDEILAHRIVWSLPFAGAMVAYSGQSRTVTGVLRQPKMMGLVVLCSLFITLNWGTYIYAVSSAQTVDAALGYFINPLFSIALAALILREKLGRGQMVAVALAFTAVVILTVELGRLPMVALLLPLSFGLYAFLHKVMPVEGTTAFTLEAMVLSGPALGYIFYLEATGAGHFLNSPVTALLLIGCGAVTAIPLLIYANATKLLRLSTIGIMQYIAPSVIFLIAVLIFREPLEPAKLAAFALIWVALVIYTAPMVRRRRKTSALAE